MRSTASNPDLRSQSQAQQQHQHNHHLGRLDDSQQPLEPQLPVASSSSPSTLSKPFSATTPQFLGIDRPKKVSKLPGIRAVSASVSKTDNNSSPRAKRAISSGSTPPLRNSVLSSSFISKTPARTPRITATASRFPSRTPLARRDQNGKVDTTTSKVAVMPPNDKPQRPLMPTLSTSSQKPAPPPPPPSPPQPQPQTVIGVGRSTPLTPKIAAGATTPSSIRFANNSNVIPITTPLGKRSHRPEPIHAGAGSRDDASGGISTPVSSFLGSNITPRSGSRQSRVDSTHSTPTGTPTADRSEAYVREARGLCISAGSEHPNNDREGIITATAAVAAMPRRTVVSFSPASSGVSTPNRSQADKRDSKFFYASDAKVKPSKQQQQQAQQPTPVRPSIAQQKQSSFFHANGDSVNPSTDRPSSERSRPSSTHAPLAGTVSPLITSPTVQQSSKFFYANGAPDVDLPDRRKFSPHNSVGTPALSAPVARSANTTPSNGLNHASARPMSPTKIVQPSVFASHKNTSLPSLARCPTVGPAAGSAGLSNASLGMNRIVTTADTPPRPSPLGHARTGSVPTVEQIISMSKLMSSQLSSECSTPVSNMSLPPGPTSAGEYFSEPEDHGSDGLQSPTRSHHSNDQLNELVANARRERKVQDLEITNASLEAINRTLERQLRKQQTELRRYRRLSRSGRLSLTSVAPSRVVSETLVAPSTTEGMSLSDLDEMEEQEEEIEEEEDDADDEDDIDTSALSGTESFESLSPEEQAIRDAKHREKDERRLELDLTKHQQLLVDSQKINQSLKRCLNWSDMMIRDGKKALAYSVRVSDIELGGRILPPPDEEGDDVLIPEFDDTFTEEYASTAQLSPRQLSVEPEMWAKVPQDRDSGIEMPTEIG